MSQAGANTKYLIFFIFPYSYVLNERRKIPKIFGLKICGFLVMAPTKLVSDQIKNAKIIN